MSILKSLLTAILAFVILAFVGGCWQTADFDQPYCTFPLFGRMRSFLAIAGSFAYRDLCNKSKTASTVDQTEEAASKEESDEQTI